MSDDYCEIAETDLLIMLAKCYDGESPLSVYKAWLDDAEAQS